MESNKHTLVKASVRCLITIILGFIVPPLVIGVIMAPFDSNIAFDPSLLFGPLLTLLYTAPIWLSICLIGFLSDIMIVSSEISLKKFVVTEWLICIIVPIWPIVDNFSLDSPGRALVYFYFILLSLPAFYLKGRFLVRRGIIANFVT